MLTWDASFEVALALRDAHPDVDLDTVSTGQLYEWVLALPEFGEEPELANENLLVAILREWYEECSGL